MKKKISIIMVMVMMFTLIVNSFSVQSDAATKYRTRNVKTVKKTYYTKKYVTSKKKYTATTKKKYVAPKKKYTSTIKKTYVAKKVSTPIKKSSSTNNSAIKISGGTVKSLLQGNKTVYYDKKGNSLGTGKKYISNASAYSGDTMTASGQRPRWGTIAVDPKVIPLGSKVYVPYFDKVFIANDTGGIIKGTKIDIFMKSSRNMYNFGRRNIEIVVLDK